MPARIRAAATLLVALATVAAGCGGDSASPEEEWAESICSPLLEWRSEMRAAGDELREGLESGAAGLADTVRETGRRAADATETMLSQLEDVGPPPVDESTDAADVVDGLADSLRATRATVTEQLDGLEADTAAEVVEALSLVAAQLTGAVAQVQTTIETLGALGGQLEDAFAGAESCRELERDADRE